MAVIQSVECGSLVPLSFSKEKEGGDESPHSKVGDAEFGRFWRNIW